MEQDKLSIAESIALRNKKWDECSDAEKIEKLKTEVLEMRHLVNRVTSLEASNHQMLQHQHGVNGEVLVSPNEHNHGIGLTGVSRVDPLR